MRKVALITGITGQDGSYLAEILLDKSYDVHGIIRRSSSFNTGRIDHIIKDEKYKNRFFFHHGDVTDASNLNRLLENIQPNEIYNLAAHESGVKKLLFLGSACIYPRNTPQPIKEEYLLSDTLEPTNEPYAIAKIAGIKLCENYHRQYGANFISIMPNNLYGPNDNFDLETSHVLPAILRKFHEAKERYQSSVEIWGSGQPLREFLHVDDMASACVFLMENLSAENLYKLGISHINAGSGEEVSIKDLALLIKDIVGYQGDLVFNTKYPDGMPRKLLDISKLNKMGWSARIQLNKGLNDLYKWYLQNNNN